MDIWTWLTEPLSFAFVQRAFLSALLVGGMCGLVGVYVVLRKMSYIGHGLSYAIFGGAVISFVIRINFFVGSIAWGFLSSMLIIWTGRRRNIGTDAAIGIITTASFAIGIILISAVEGLRTDFDAALFGNILSLNDTDIWVIIGTAIVISLCVFFSYKQLLFMTFDPDVAPIYGVRGRTLDALFSLMIATLLIAALRVVGVTLIAAALITPPTIARMLTDSFHKLLAISVVVGAFGGVVGIYASWYLDWATGGTIVATYALLFVITFLFRRFKDWQLGE